MSRNDVYHLLLKVGTLHHPTTAHVLSMYSPCAVHVLSMYSHFVDAEGEGKVQRLH